MIGGGSGGAMHAASWLGSTPPLYPSGSGSGHPPQCGVGGGWGCSGGVVPKVEYQSVSGHDAPLAPRVVHAVLPGAAVSRAPLGCRGAPVADRRARLGGARGRAARGVDPDRAGPRAAERRRHGRHRPQRGGEEPAARLAAAGAAAALGGAGAASPAGHRERPRLRGGPARPERFHCRVQPGLPAGQGPRLCGERERRIRSGLRLRARRDVRQPPPSRASAPPSPAHVPAQRSRAVRLAAADLRPHVSGTSSAARSTPRTTRSWATAGAR